METNYTELFDSCILTTEPTRILELRSACKTILVNEPIYWKVESETGVPWFVIAFLHYRESNLNFKCHLHNGDPLTERTKHVPKDRPLTGSPPFTWSHSAIDALTGRQHPFRWDVAGVLGFCERYNGLGYRYHQMNSPYLWSCTDKYSSGLFVADGTLDMSKKDARPGVAALLKNMIDTGVSLEFETRITPDTVIH